MWLPHCFSFYMKKLKMDTVATKYATKYAKIVSYKVCMKAVAAELMNL